MERMVSGFAEEQERRVTKAVIEGPEMVWTKTPLGWLVQTKNGGCYQVDARGSCSCPDFRHRCQGTELRCAHVVALRMRLLAEPEPVVTPEEERAARWAAAAERWLDEA
jgi:hypothetical protein